MMTMRALATSPAMSDHEQKRRALACVEEAWVDGQSQGVDTDCLAQVCLFTALAELVSTYGEEATATYAEGFASRIRNGEFSLNLLRQ